MRLVCCLAATVALTSLAARAPAQQPIRVVRHSPVDTARAGDVITISFDRPVAGSVERSANPERFVRIEPAVAATVQWRDLVTLRVIPNEPLPPSRRLRITVDTSFTALDGGRLAAPYQFTLTTAGPGFLGSSPPLSGNPAELQPGGRLTFVYSAMVDTALLANTVRAELTAGPGCEGGVVRYAVVSQRAVADTDDYAIQAVGGYVDDLEARLRRVIELRPRTALPENCRGALVVPSLDPNDRAEIRYPLRTANAFRIADLRCSSDDCAASGALVLSFSASVRREDLIGRVHIEPETPFTIPEADGAPSSWTLHFAVVPRTTYRVRVDSTLRDSFGRRLTRSTTVSLQVGDRTSALGHQLGLFTLSRSHPMLRVTHVNIDSAEIAFIPIPDAMRSAALLALADPDSVARMVSRLRDSVKLKVALRAVINEERITEIPVPREVLERYRGSLIAIRAKSTQSMRERTRRNGLNKLEAITIVATGEELTNRVAIVQVTDLAVHARVSNSPGAVFVTDVNTGTAIGGASVTVRDTHGTVMATGMSDASGVAALRLTPGWVPLVRQATEDEWWYGTSDRYWDTNKARLVDVRHGDDRSFVRITPDPYADWAASYPGPERPDVPSRLVRALAYTDRAIYRPSERVYLGVIARNGWLGDLKTLPEGDSLRIRVAAFREGSGPDIVRDTIVHLNRFGTAADSFRLANATPLGWYSARVDIMTPGGWRRRSGATFRVAEYRAPQFRASLVLDSAARFLGDTIRGRANGSYYFGAAMAGAAVHWRTSTERADAIEIPSLPKGFIVAHRYRDGSNEAGSGGAASGTDTLNAQGTVSLAMPTVAGALTGPARVEAEISVEDLDRQMAVATESAILHSSSFYIAVRDSGTGWYWRQGQPRTLEVLTVTPAGARVPGRRIGLTIIRRHSAYVFSANGGGATWRWVADTIGRDSVVTGDSIVHVSFTPVRDGSYEIAFDTRDERGRPVATSIGAYVIPPQWFGSWGLDPTALAIRLERDTIAAGDSAVVSVLSPFPRAEAWVTVEREGILAQVRRNIQQGEVTFKIPVTDRFIPEATIRVLLVDAAPAWQTDSVHRRIRTDEVSLTVDKTSKSLAVEIRTTPRYAPGDSARLSISVRDSRGRPVRGQVTLWAVDEAVLALTDSTRLSPLDSMYEERGSSLMFASTAATLASQGRNLHPPGWVRSRYAFGVSAMNSVAVAASPARSEIAEIIPRTDFRTTAFYLASLETDTTGMVTAVAKLPDNLTTYRVVAVAVDRGDRFGTAETSITTTKPLLARAALPRFVRTGDAFAAGAVVTNQTGAAVSSTVTAFGRAISLEGDTLVGRPLANGASSEFRFAWKATASPGDTASFRFVVNGGANADAVQTPVVILPPYSPRFHAMAGVSKGSETVRMMLPLGIDPKRSRLTLRLGTTPAGAVQAAYQHLRRYPYLCSEQLASRGRAVVAMLRLERAGLLDSTTAVRPDELRDQLQWVVDELTRRQTFDGGMGYWSPVSWTSAPLSTYAGLVLLDARELGVAVRPVVLERLSEYMREALDSTAVLPDSTFGAAAERRSRTASRLSGRLAALQYLRRAGAPDVVHEDELLPLSHLMAWEDRVWLTELLSHREDRGSARRMLAQVWRDVEIAGTRVDVPDSLLNTFGFRSHVRPVARLLQTTMAIDQDHPRLPWLVERIVQQGRATRDWVWNTQDYAAAAEALTQAALWQRKSTANASITIQSARRGSGDQALVRTTAGRNGEASIPLDGLVERDGDWTVLRLRVSAGDARVFYVLTVEEVPLDPPTTPDAKGIVVERWYERFDDGRPVSEVKEGDLIRARLRITVPSDREFVAIADPLPAGLEVVDLSLRTSRTIGPFESEGYEAADRAGARANAGSGGYYGTWWGGWWSPWEHQEMRDDRVLYFARVLWKGTYTASYVARATTAGTFIRPPAHAEEMYNPSLGGRSDGGVLKVVAR